MVNTQELIRNLLRCIDLEEKEQVNKFRLDQQHSLKGLRSEGLALHPIIITRKSFGYADYPEFSFRLNYPADTGLFRDGSAIECFLSGGEAIKGVLINLEGRSGEFRLFAPDFPDWIEDDNVGIKLAPDQHTTQVMKTALNNIESNKRLLGLFEQLHEVRPPAIIPADVGIVSLSPGLNQSQQMAVAAMVHNRELVVLHGPPGTGKTTTLVEGIVALVQRGEKVLVTAPSNAAVDTISARLISKGIRLLRVGNTSKVNAEVFAHTPEAMLANSRMQKEIRQLKIQAEAYRKMALQYKRSFGKAEREQRNLLFREVKSIRSEIKKLLSYNEDKLFDEAQVISGTPVALYDAQLKNQNFATVVIDEAGQCLEPLAWCVFPLAEKIVLAGDHLQLPPTVLSSEAQKLGFTRSILEIAMSAIPNSFLLDIQYRMRESIAGFSSEYFYKGLLNTPPHLANTASHLSFIDTAGSGYNEIAGQDSISLQNPGELQIAELLLKTELPNAANVAFISPYAAQVAAAKEKLPAELRISTIDSFQGQEHEVIILSLVRSNDEGAIGFLKDYRRMNVAMTRAKEKLVIIGDSATIGADPFYNSLLNYIEMHGEYRSVWEFEL